MGDFHATQPTRVKTFKHSRTMSPCFKAGFFKEGYFKEGYFKEGYFKEGYFKEGYFKEGYFKEEYPDQQNFRLREDPSPQRLLAAEESPN